MVPASLNDKFVIRFCVCAERATDRDILVAWEIIRQAATSILGNFKNFSISAYCSCASKNSSSHALLAEAEANEPPLAEEDETAESPLAGGESAMNDEESLAASLAARRNHTLEHKRSFLVRMVSDPKCYNPKIVRTLTSSRRRLSEDLKRDLSLKVDIAGTDGSGDEPSPVVLPEDTGIQSPM
jgi:tyrosine decarboxylase